jgi:hypothetical protein
MNCEWNGRQKNYILTAEYAVDAEHAENAKTEDRQDTDLSARHSAD